MIKLIIFFFLIYHILILKSKETFKQKKVKYLVFKASGGLGHALKTLDTAINIADETNRFLIIDFKCSSVFKFDFSDLFYIKNMKYADKYDSIDSNLNYMGISIEKLKNITPLYKNGNYFYNHNCISDFVNTDDDIIVFSSNKGKYNNLLGNKYNLFVQPNIMEMLNKETKIEKNYMSMHFRNTDIENNINNFIKKIKSINLNILYLASDDFTSYKIIKNEIPNLKIIRYTIPENIKPLSLHYHSKDKFLQNYECIRDIYFILKSKYFIPSRNSNLSKIIIHMINTNKFIFPNFTSNTIII